MAVVEFKYETIYTDTYEKYGDVLEVIAKIKTSSDSSGYYKGLLQVDSITLQVLDGSGKDITKELYATCPGEAKIIEMDAESVFNGRVERGH